MIQTLKTIRLYSHLGARFGREFRLAVASPAEAVRALCALIPGFEKELITSKNRGIGYTVFIGKRNVGKENLHDPAGGEDIRIAPVMMGAKRGGLGQILLGMGLIVASVFTFGSSSLAFAAQTMGVSGSGLFGTMGIYATVANIGAALALGGVAQLLTSNQRATSTSDGPDNGASYNFNGPINTTAQGNPVPVHYGRLIIGGATISAGIFAEDQA